MENGKGNEKRMKEDAENKKESRERGYTVVAGTEGQLGADGQTTGSPRKGGNRLIKEKKKVQDKKGGLERKAHPERRASAQRREKKRINLGQHLRFEKKKKRKKQTHNTTRAVQGRYETKKEES